MKEKINVLWDCIERVVLNVIKRIEILSGSELKNDTKRTIVQFVKFGIVGVSNTLLSYLINIITLLCLASLNVSWDYFVANIVAFVLSVFWSFCWNYSFVFEKRKESNVWLMLLKTYMSYGITGLLLANILSYILVGVIDISKYIAPMVVLIVSVPMNFILNKLWAFK